MIQFKFLYGPEVLAAEELMPIEQRVAWPADSMVLYAFNDEDKIVGRMGSMAIKIIEGTWVAPEQRGTLAVRLMKQMEQLLKYLGNTHAMAMAYTETPEIADYLQRFGFKQEPLQIFSKEL